jgi:acetyl-CoA carboxylase biotin carboxyl carrier protein
MKEKLKLIKEMAKSINTYGVDSVEYENDDFKVKIKKNIEEKVIYTASEPQSLQSVQPVQTINAQNVESIEEKPVQEDIQGTKVESPMVGTFYAAPSPASPVYVKEGDKVSEGDTLCIVEAMKLMNEIKASVSGTIKKIYAKDGSTIKKGDVLMVID